VVGGREQGNMDKVRSFRDLEVYKKLVRLHCAMQQPGQDKPIPNRSFINYNIQLRNYKIKTNAQIIYFIFLF
jgi:hypothetical protein